MTLSVGIAGEVVVKSVFAKNGSSYGGVQNVVLKVVSTGDRLMGITYAVPEKVSSGGPKLDGIICDPAELAPGGTFAHWVPTVQDINSYTEADLPVNLVVLHKRARALFADAGRALSGWQTSGRAGLRNYDLVDILPGWRRMPYRENFKPEEVLVEALAVRHAKIAAGRERGITFVVHDPAENRESGPGAAALELAAKFEPHMWYLGRVMWEGGTADGPADWGGSPSSKVAEGKPMVYWFEPGTLPGSAKIIQVLRKAPLNAMRGIAPASTYTFPYVAGMAVDIRPFSGRCMQAEIISASRFLLQLRIHRPVGLHDRSSSASVIKSPSSVKVRFVEDQSAPDSPKQRGPDGLILAATSTAEKLKAEGSGVHRPIPMRAMSAPTAAFERAVGLALGEIPEAEDLEGFAARRWVSFAEPSSPSLDTYVDDVPHHCWRHVIARPGVLFVPATIPSPGSAAGVSMPSALRKISVFLSSAPSTRRSSGADAFSGAARSPATSDHMDGAPAVIAPRKRSLFSR